MIELALIIGVLLCLYIHFSGPQEAALRAYEQQWDDDYYTYTERLI